MSLKASLKKLNQKSEDREETPVAGPPVMKAKPDRAMEDVKRYAQNVVTDIRGTLKKKHRDVSDFVTLSELEENALNAAVTEWIPTTFRNIDHIFGGGLPVGKMIDLYGPSGAGKSALTHCCTKGTQQVGGLPFHSDYEFAMETRVIDQLNINREGMIYATPEYLDDFWNCTNDLLDRRQVEFDTARKANRPLPPLMLGVMDSLAAAQPEAEKDAKVGESMVAVAARINSRGCRKLIRKLGKLRFSVLFVNQERASIGGPAFAEKPTPGGDAVKYFCSIRARVTRVATLKQGDRATGYLCRVTTAKCRLAPPHQRAVFVLDFKYGPSPALTALHLLTEAKVARNVQGRYVLPWTGKKPNRDEFVALMADPEFHAKAWDTAMANVAASVTPPGARDDEDDEE